MKIFKTKSFNGFKPLKDLTEFVNEQNIKKEDIITITQDGANFVIFYYEEHS